MRDRSAVVIIQNGQVALIKRVRDHEVYYVFPGGGIESGETPVEAAAREAFEELSVEVDVGECFAKVQYQGTQYFFHAHIIGGIFGAGQGEEYTEVPQSRGDYIPLWVDLSDLAVINVKPVEVGVKVMDLWASEEEKT
ncbi:NUDIX domain-containing protein [Jeotgalibacillus terrae]|uniref:NUDIX domain-containing protein n=1 Tax=Jeotgalibacillus terrae TaxID=587735 RepID=A0ABW5ZJQ7_9BACL|nr:mutator protein MutT [Jeotgalibacillus terrae]